MPEAIGAKQAPIFTHDRREGQGMYLTRAILHGDPYPVKAMLVAGGNPMLTFPDSKAQTKAFEKLDFLAVFDLFMTPTARLANLLLPAADFFETLELHDYGQGGPPYLGLTRPVTTDPKGWPVWKLLFELAHKLGLEKLFPWTDNRDAIAYKLSASGIGLNDLLESPSVTVQYDGRKASDECVPGRKVHYYSKEIETTGNPGLPTPTSLVLPSLTEEDFPFWLSTGDRVPFFQHSQFRATRTYIDKMPEPFLDVHPDAAHKIGVERGDRVVLSTRQGKIDVRVELNEDVRPDCLRITHGWEEANANELAGLEHLDPISGFPWMRALPARLERKES
jgi:anaerobic selenocysteine-containing dehydrogenase